jgi:hypothetical protein
MKAGQSSVAKGLQSHFWYLAVHPRLVLDLEVIEEIGEAVCFALKDRHLGELAYLRQMLNTQ